MNIAILGHRGSGKTTLCHKLAGLDCSVQPNGTSTLNYVGCTWNNIEVLIWDFPPGLSPETLTFLADINQVVVCADGRRLQSTRNCLKALSSLFSGKVTLAVTKSNFRSSTLPLTMFDLSHAGKPIRAFFTSSSCNGLRNFLISNNNE